MIQLSRSWCQMMDNQKFQMFRFFANQKYLFKVPKITFQKYLIKTWILNFDTLMAIFD